MRNAGTFAARVVVASPGRPTALGVAVIRRLVTPWTRALFRPRWSGTENLPTERPYLLVANHSAGVGAAEIACFAALWLRDLGPERPIAGFALPLGFVLWPFSWMHRQLGTVPSTYAAAHDALRRGVPLLVFPGGDHESLKPVWQNHRVDFAGRVGFLRIAREAGVPIVPLGIRNGAWTAPIVFRSSALAWMLLAPRLMGVKRWGVSLLALIGAAAIGIWLPTDLWIRSVVIWLWLGSPLTFLPIVPASIRLRVGRPIEPTELFAGDDREQALRSALLRVERDVEVLVRAW